MPSRLTDATALVTGASSGIGLELSRQIAPLARTLALVARRGERLEELRAELAREQPGLRVVVATCDLEDRVATDAMLERLEREVGTIDVLVNNAGFGDMGVFDRSDWTKIERMLDLNVKSLAYLTHRLSGAMVRQGRGGILNISSSLGMTMLPGMAAYIGTKHFVTGFSEALRIDLAGTGVTVTQVCPGPVRTEFNDRMGNLVGFDTPGLVEISAVECARAAVEGFERGQAIVVPGTVTKGLILVSDVTPRFVVRAAFGTLARLMRRKQERG